MRVAIPHDLPRAEVRKRLRESSHEIADHIPGGLARVTTDWASEDRMNINVKAMGQDLTGTVDIEESQLVFAIALPAALGFLEPMISGVITQQSRKMLAAPSSSSPSDD